MKQNKKDQIYIMKEEKKKNLDIKNFDKNWKKQIQKKRSRKTKTI